jgi:hypothetical protein
VDRAVSTEGGRNSLKEKKVKFDLKDKGVSPITSLS